MVRGAAGGSVVEREGRAIVDAGGARGDVDGRAGEGLDQGKFDGLF